MRLLTTVFLLSILPIQLLFSQTKKVKKLPTGSQVIEDFENDKEGTLPRGWYDQKGEEPVMSFSKEQRKEYKYRIVKEGGNRFLRYDGRTARHINFPLINKDKENIYDINLYETPILSWKVRAHKLPKNAREDDDNYNDTVASIYVFFDMGRIALIKKVPKTIRYTWSTTLDKGTETSKLFGNQQIRVVKSGSEDTGKWIIFKRNLVEDYRHLFGDDPPKTPIAIIILSDGDSTDSWVKADYDDIKLLPKSETSDN